MKNYTQLTNDQRYQIYGLRQARATQTEIAARIGVHKSTVCRELTRNVGERGWRPRQAQEKSLARRQQARYNAVKFHKEAWHIVDGLLEMDYSPEQVSGRLAMEKTLEISHERIYLHVYADKQSGGSLWTHLRCQKQRRKRYSSGQNRRGIIKDRIVIDQRPAIVEKSTRLGDWEGDTVIGKGQKGALVTLAERMSRYALAHVLEGKKAAPVTKQITSLLKPHGAKVHTITFDNGKEFAHHGQIARALKADIYFAHPYHSWERGLNENTNGLLRQYFPKETDFTKVTQEQVQRAIDRLNHRPRKVLGFRSPHEVFFSTSLCYSPDIKAVALRC